MSVNTYIHVGPYVVCKTKKVTVPNEQRVCGKKKEHSVSMNDKFCRKCGAPVVSLKVDLEEFCSFADYHYGNTPDEEHLTDVFNYQAGEFIGFDEEGYEVLLHKNAKYIDGDYPGVHALSPSLFSITEDVVRDVALLKRVVGYESVEIKCGVIVAMS